MLLAAFFVAAISFPIAMTVGRSDRLESLGRSRSRLLPFLRGIEDEER
jgi:hypothetical protein